MGDLQDLHCRGMKVLDNSMQINVRTDQGQWALSIRPNIPVWNSGYCLISYREGLGTSLLIMGLATIDPHSQKEHTEIYKIPKFGVNQASFDWDTGI